MFSPFSKEMLESLGIAATESEIVSLNKRFGNDFIPALIRNMADRLDSDQIKKLNEIKNNNDALIYEWLSVNVPDFDEVVEEEVYAFLNRIGSNG